MKHDVSIIHVCKDKSIADAICGKLKSARLKYWIPAPDISAGEDRKEATRNAIASSRVTVVVLSENANAAPEIKREIAHAFYRRRPIIPFRVGATLPRREFLFYLGNAPWVSADDPPGEEQLEALSARIKELVPAAALAGNVLTPQIERGPTPTRVSHDRTLGILKWASIATILGSGAWALWFGLRQPKDGRSLAESHPQSMHGSAASPVSSPEANRNAAEPKPTSTSPRFGLWQAANGSPTPLVQVPQALPVNSPEGRPAIATSSPAANVSPKERVVGLPMGPRPGHLPPVRKQVSSDHHQPYPGTQVKEARKIADLENQRYSLRSQLKETEAKLDLVTNQRDGLQNRLNESEERAQTAQKNAQIVASELDTLRDQLKETEKKALTAQKDEELVRSNLQSRLRETEDEIQTVKKNADLATQERDALQSELGEVRERAQRAEIDANLAANRRDALEAELKKTQEEAPGEKTQPTQLGADLARMQNSAPDTQFQEVRQDTQSAHENAGFAQTQPPNPGPDAKPVPLTQALESTGPSH